MRVSRILRNKGRTLIAVCAGLILGAQTLAPVAQATENEIATISDGYVNWGIKQSWRQYVGDEGITVRGGVQKNSDGTYRWPISSGTYDASSKTLELQLGGEVQFQSHCVEVDGCLLDSTFSDMRLIISADTAYIQADYDGVLMEDWYGGIKHFEDALIATLNYQNATYQSQQGNTWSAYSGLEAIAGPGLLLYAEGTSLDGVEIGYTGPGGLNEVVTALNPGVPVFETGDRWDSGLGYTDLKSGWRIFASQSHDVIYQVDSQETANAAGQYRLPTVTVRVLDSKTLQEITKTTFPGVPDTSGRFSISNVVFDPATDTLYAAFPEQAAANNALGVTGLDTHVVAIQYDGSTLQADTEYATIEGVGYRDYPRMGYLPQRKELAIVTQGQNAQLIRIAGKQQVNAQVLAVDELCQDVDFDYDEEADDIIEIAVNPTELLSQENNDSNLYIETETGMSRFWVDPGIRPYSKLVNFDFTAEQPTMECVSNFPATNWSASSIPPYKGFQQLGDGTYLAYGAAGSYTAVRPVATGVEAVQANAKLQHFEVNGPEFTASAADGSNTYHFAPLESKVWVYGTNAAPVRSFELENVSNAPQLTNRTGIVVTKDGSLVYPDVDPTTGTHGLRLLHLLGKAATFASHPASQTVEVLDDAAQTVTFTAAVASSTGSTQLQWQAKEPKSFWFVDIPGATSETLEVSADQSLDGMQYRLTVTDDLGTAASEAATLNVVAKPYYLHQPEDVTVEAGQEVRFFAQADGNPAPVVTWQQYVDDRWQLLYTHGNVQVDDMGVVGTQVVISDVDEAWHGRQIRAIARNDYGDVPSDVVTIKIAGVAETEEPEETEEVTTPPVAETEIEVAPSQEETTEPAPSEPAEQPVEPSMDDAPASEASQPAEGPVVNPTEDPAVTTENPVPAPEDPAPSAPVVAEPTDEPTGEPTDKPSAAPVVPAEPTQEVPADDTPAVDQPADNKPGGVLGFFTTVFNFLFGGWFPGIANGGSQDQPADPAQPTEPAQRQPTGAIALDMHLQFGPLLGSFQFAWSLLWNLFRL